MGRRAWLSQPVRRSDRREATGFRFDHGLEGIPTQGALLIQVGAYFLYLII